MALLGDERQVLIDCVSNPIVRLQKAGINHEDLTDLVMTHFHPDHVSGVPLLLTSMSLLNRSKPLNVYGLEQPVRMTKMIIEEFGWDQFQSFSANFHLIEEKPMLPLIETGEFRIFTSPVQHFIPTIGMRIEFPRSGKVFAYSCDTAPTPSVIELAKDADVLIHEAAGASPGHSSAAQAGEAATQAGAKELYMIHYPVGGFDYHKLVDEAAQTFDGPIKMAEDFMELEF
jgi:ribonuclease Z